MYIVLLMHQYGTLIFFVAYLGVISLCDYSVCRSICSVFFVYVLCSLEILVVHSPKFQFE